MTVPSRWQARGSPGPDGTGPAVDERGGGDGRIKYLRYSSKPRAPLELLNLSDEVGARLHAPLIL
jgi:hypothetical protein